MSATRDECRKAISDAYYEARNQGHTMEQAADNAADAVETILTAAVDGALRTTAARIESDAANAWGGSAAWLTTGDKVAQVVACWIRDDADAAVGGVSA